MSRNPLNNKQTAGMKGGQILLGVIALGFGVLLYLFDRPPSQVYFIPAEISLYQGSTSLFGGIGNHLPTFLHVFAFALITSGVLACERRGALWVCVFWFVVDALFEVGQHPAVAARIVSVIPSWFAKVPLLENAASYFERGSFDIFDLLSIFLGALAAYGVLALWHQVVEQGLHGRKA